MSFGADCLINKLNGCIVGLGTDLATACDFAQVSGSLNSLENATLSVPNVNSLPAAADNEGRFIYVEDIKSFRYSDGYYWTKDACSVLGDPSNLNLLWTWGSNVRGQLGNVTTVNRCSPGTVAGDGFWIAISAGNCHASGIKSDGTLWTWGCNAQGQLGDGTTVSRCSPGTVAGGGTNWFRVSGGSYHTLAIKTDGTLWTWGCNGQGRLGNGNTITRCSPGTVAGGGFNWCKADAVGSTLAIKTDGTLWTWGCGNNGNLGNGTTVDRCSPGTVAGGGTTWCDITADSMAIKTDGTLWTWGFNSSGQSGDGTAVSRCSPGTVWGSYTTWCQISTGSLATIAIKCDGTLWTWGSNIIGQLGNGTAGLTCRCSPGTVAGGGTNWCQLATGGVLGSAMAAIKTDGTLWTWGCNNTGQLGNGTAAARCSPGTIAGGGTTWYIVSNGADHTFAVKSGGF